MQNKVIASAATPTFAETKIEINGEGKTYPLVINNKVDGSTYKWSSSKTSVAIISSKGVVTAVSKGSATITCKVTYPNKKTKTLTAKVTVLIPATAISINNANEVNGTHTMLLGETYNFNRDIVPTNSSDKTYWTIAGGDKDCLRIDDADSGIVTAIKAGKVILKAIAAKTATPEAAANSIVDDAVIIEVVGPSATVNSAEIVGSNELKVVFDSPIDKTTVIGTSNKLLDSIEITMRKNTKGVLASDPGNLTATLSEDGKTLTITSANKFDGDYGINITNKVKTTGQIAIESYYKQLSFFDTVPPTVVGYALDDTGFISIIQFSEPISITNLKVSKAALAYNTGSISQADPVTLSIMNNKLNYVLSTDKKSLSINLSGIASKDFNKSFSVSLTGIEDLSGNAPAEYILTAYLSTNNTPKPQAVPLSVTRTSYNTLTATYSRSIKTPGYVILNDSSYHLGVVDVNDNKKVNFTISDGEAMLTGAQKVDLYGWDSYNVISTDTSAQIKKPFYINFITDQTSPVLIEYSFDQPTSTLTLTYNEDVTLTILNGIFNSKLLTTNDDIRSNTMLNYVIQPSTDKKIIKLTISNMTMMGTYTFTMAQGFVVDGYRNQSLSRDVTISNMNGSSTELPVPYNIAQSTTNLNQIFIDFANKIDVESAQNVTNYSIPGVQIISATVTKNTSDTGATIMLTVADGSITLTAERPITIKGIRGYNGSYTPMNDYTKKIEFKDNQKPTFLSCEFDKTLKNRIIINFNEEVTGTASFKLTLISGTTSRELAYTVTTSNNAAYINLPTVPDENSYIRIEVLSNALTDISGNQSTLPSQMGALVSFK
jgi:hypothetical protein